jgi:hypothetical protein
MAPAGPAAARGASADRCRHGGDRRPGDRLVTVGADAADWAGLVYRILRRRRARAGGESLAGCDPRLAPASECPAAAVHRQPGPGSARAGLVRALPGAAVWRAARLAGRPPHAAGNPAAARALDDTGPVMAWTGAAALAINQDAEIGAPANVRAGDMAAWDLASGAWRRLPGAPAPLQADITPVWTGRELLAIATDGSLLSFAP